MGATRGQMASLPKTPVYFSTALTHEKSGKWRSRAWRARSGVEPREQRHNVWRRAFDDWGYRRTWTTASLRSTVCWGGEGGGEVRNGFELNREKRIGRSDVFLAGRVKPCLVISVPVLSTVHLVAGQCTVIPGLLPTVDLQWPCCWPTVTLMSWPSVTLMPNSFLNSFVVTLKVRPAFVPASRSYQQRWLADWLQAVFLRYAPLRRTKHNWSCLRIIARSFVALLFCYWKQCLRLRPRPHSEAPTASQWPVPMDCSPRLNSAWYEVHAVPLLHNTS